MLQFNQCLRSLFVLCALSVTLAYAQVAPLPPLGCYQSTKLSCLTTQLYTPTGLTLPNAFHQAHFESSFEQNFRALNAAVANQLTRLPLASPASGFTFTFDTAAGVFTRSAESLGPVLTERAETIGRGKFYLGFTYQRFKFDSLDGVDLGNVPVVFAHKEGTGPASNPDPAYEKDFLTTNTSIDLRVNQFTVFGTVGLTNRIDLSLAVPILDVSMNVNSPTTIHRTAPPSPIFGQFHYFDPKDSLNSISKNFGSSGTASGIGDVLVRVKGTVKRWESSSLALAADIRTPTGDSHNFLGAGAVGIKPFVAYSTTFGRLAPHLNLGYEINGSSILAGNTFPQTPTKGHLPNQLVYAAGTDIGVTRSLTLAFDFLGARVFKASRIGRETYTPQAPELNPGPATYPNIGVTIGSFNMDSGSAGLKWNPFGRFLITGNVLFRLDNGGLRANVVPLVGASYSFQ